MKKKKGISKKAVISWIIVLVPIIILLIGFANKTNIVSQPKAEKGSLDISQWDLAENGNIKLDGEWEFYWNKLLTPDEFKDSIKPQKTGYFKVPGIWNGYKAGDKKLTGSGYASFRLMVKIPDPSKLYALKIIT